MKNKSWDLRVFAGVLSVILLAESCGKKQEQTKPQLADVTESVYASAKVKAEDQYTLYPTMNGTLSEVLVEAGDTVKEGQILFRLDDLTAGLNSENARLAWEISKENAEKGSDKIRELEIASGLAREKFRLDTDLFLRQKNLWAQGVGSKAEYDQKALALENSKANLESARNRLEQVKTQLKNELERSRINYEISRKQNRDFYIRSVRKGRIFDVLKKPGELVSPQTPMAILGSEGAFIIELDVDQADITRIRPGQEVLLNLDSYKGEVFEATLTRIYPIMEERTRTFKAEARFKKEPPFLFPNLTAEANIVVRQKIKALTIPRAYLLEGRYVLTGKNEKKEVRIGLRDYQKVEIISGIDSSTTLFKP